MYSKIMKQNSVLLPIGLSVLVIAAYGFRQYLQQSGLPIDPYYTVLFALPILLILFKKFSFVDLGFRVGKPLVGIFFVFLLPVVLYFRWSLTGRPIVAPTTFPLMLLIGSFAEEFFFRGYLQEDFKKRFGGNIWIALVLSNILFALVHFVKGYSLAATAMTGLIGVYFGITKDEQGGNSLFYSMVAHGLYNLIAAAVV